VADRPWSLTRRLALRFALMTSALLTLYALGSAYVLHATLHAELDDFLDQELDSFTTEIARSGGSPPALQAATERINQGKRALPRAYRVRDGQGRELVQVGRAGLLQSPAVEESDDGLRLPAPFGPTIVLRRAPVPGSDLVAEVVVDSSANQAAVYGYLVSAGGTLVIFVALAAVSARFTARRGLRSLADLAEQARAIEGPERGAALRLQGAPDELRELVGELNAMLERIEAGLRSMKTFTAGLAHELRSPLQNLMGETEVALLSERPAQEYAQLLRSNLDDLHDLSDAIDNLIAWCRSAEPGQPRGAFESFDFAREARMRLERERRTAERGGMALRISSSGDTRLVADREGSLRVLRNLVSNAIAWSPQGGDIEVRIEGDGQGVRIAVEDRGPGIPGELADRIFEPFVTGRARRGVRGGYGLGLAICRTIMLQHGGSLLFEPRQGGGTRFVARFPRSAQRAA